MKTRDFIIALVIMAIFLAAVGCGPAASPTPTPTPAEHKGKVLVANRCIACHPLTIVESARYDQTGWENIVKRMVTNGAQLDTD